MKKLVTIMLVLAMVLSFSGIAFAQTFSDTADLSKDAQAAIAKLDALGVVGGYPDGTFKPAGNITRAEFAKIAVQLAGMGSTQESLKNSASQFADVKTGMWYTGWVNLATSQGFLMGYPDGTFRPDAKITYEEVVTILLRILGYDSNLAGPWPTEYIARAAALGITDDIPFTVGAFATRADVAQMAKELLDQFMVTWDADSQNFINSWNYVDTDDDDGTTLLEYSFKGMVQEDYVVMDWEKNDSGYKVAVTPFDEDWDWNEESVKFDLTDDVVILGANTVPSLTGFIVDYIDEDGDISYIEVTSTALYSDDVEVNDDEEVVVDDENFEQYEGDSMGLEEDDLINGDFYDIYLTEDGEVYDYYNETDAIADGVYDVRLVDQNKGSKITFKSTHGDSGSLTSLDTKDVLVIRNGQYAELSDITENDVLYVNDAGHGPLDLYLKAYSIDATGNFDAEYTGNPDKWKIAGTKYVVNDMVDVSRDNGDEFDSFYDTSEDLLDGIFDTEVKYYLNYANQVEFLISNVEEDTDVIYGAINEIIDTTSKDYVTRIEILKADGDMQKYDVNLDELEIEEDVDIWAGQLVKFKVDEDGDIEDVTILAVADDEVPGVYAATDYMIDEDYTDEDNDDYAVIVTGGDADANKVKIENMDGDNLLKYTDDDTVVFNFYSFVDDGDDVVITDVEDFLDWAEDYGAGAYVYVQYDGSKIKYIAVSDSDLPGTSYKYGAVTGKSYRSGDDRKVEVDTRGTEKTYVQAEYDDIYYVGELYEYYLDGSDFTVDDSLVFDPDYIYNDGGYLDDTVGDIVYAVYTVSEVDTDNETVELYIDEDMDNRLDADETVVTFALVDDSVLYDYSDWYDDGDAPTWAELADFEADDLVMIGATDAEDDDEILFLFKVNNMDDDQVEEINAYYMN